MQISEENAQVPPLLQLGMVVQQVRLDQNNAYHIVPIHPQGQQLWGIIWVGRIYTDQALPFGLR